MRSGRAEASQQRMLDLRLIEPGGSMGFSQFRALAQAFGPDIVDLTRAYRDHDPFCPAGPNGSTVIERKVDAFAAEFAGETYRPNGNAPHGPSEYLRGLVTDDANAVLDYLLDSVLPPGNKTAGVRNELRFGTPSLSESKLRYILSSGDRVDPRLSHQAGVQLMLGHLSGLMRSHHESIDVGTLLWRLNNHLDQHLWVGPAGKTEKARIYAVHNDETNSMVFGFHDREPDFELEEGHHFKLHEYEVRTAMVDGEPLQVHSFFRQKGFTSSVVKSLREAVQKMKKGEEPIIQPRVKDLIGGTFIVFGTDEQRAKFAEELFRTIDGGFVITSIDPDHYVNGKPDQSDHVEFERYQVKMAGIDQPWEFMFFAPDKYINYLFNVKSAEDPDAPIDGQAHDLYLIRRAFEVFEFLFPKELYPDIDYDTYKRLRMEATAKMLKSIHRWQPPFQSGETYNSLPRPFTVPPHLSISS